VISIVIPTYNEARNIQELIPEVAKVVSDERSDSFEIIVVDDNSPDGTWRVAEAMAREYPVRVIRRWAKLGLASAVMLGFFNSRGEILICMDGDFQHDPKAIPALAEGIEQGYDIAIGSRYVADGRIDGAWRVHRHWMSSIATRAANLLTDVKDPMSGFFAVSASLLQDIKRYDLLGYKVLFEILVKGTRARSDLRIKEIPIHFNGRKSGETKLNLGEVWRYGVLYGKLVRSKMSRRGL